MLSVIQMLKSIWLKSFKTSFGTKVFIVPIIVLFIVGLYINRIYLSQNSIMESFLISIFSGLIASLIIYNLIEIKESASWQIANDRVYIDINNHFFYAWVTFLSILKQLPVVPIEVIKKSDGKLYFNPENRLAQQSLICKKIKDIAEEKLNETIEMSLKKINQSDFEDMFNVFNELADSLTNIITTMPQKLKPEQYGHISNVIRSARNLEKFSKFFIIDVTSKDISKENAFDASKTFFLRELVLMATSFWNYLNSEKNFKKWGYLVIS